MTNDPIFLAACDSVYFERFAPALVSSCIQFDHSVHIHIINPTTLTWQLIEQIVDKSGGVGNHFFTYSFSSLDISGLSTDPHISTVSDTSELSSYYASSRFFVARDWLANNPFSHLVVIDVDCYLNNRLEIPRSCPVGLYLREPLAKWGDHTPTEWERAGTFVAAGIVYLSASVGLQYIRSVCDKINTNKGRWFVDQWALHQTYLDMGLDKYRGFIDLSQETPNILDWEFHDDSIIWTGKAKRKYQNARYVNRMNQLSQWINK